MVLTVALFVIAVLIALIWIVIEMKRLRHKLFAIFLISLILLFYVSFALSIRGHDIDYKTVPGVIQIAKIYFSWLSFAFGNVVQVTSSAIKMDWTGNGNSTKGS